MIGYQKHMYSTQRRAREQSGRMFSVSSQKGNAQPLKRRTRDPLVRMASLLLQSCNWHPKVTSCVEGDVDGEMVAVDA
jgi:hypothetical protein